MHLKKHLSQHILIAEPTAEKIVRTLAPAKNDVVLEIGPGTGNLTRHLARYAGKVIAVEKDPEMIKQLHVSCSTFQNVEIIQADFLKLDLTSTLQHLNTQTLFCGNLPYNISTPILFKLKDNRKIFSRGVIMIQKEVAQRLTAKAGNKDYGILSIMMRVSARMEKCFNVSAKSFVPPPKVTSSVVKIEFPEKEPYHIENKGLFDRIVKSSFGKRRKMIRNSIPREYLPALKDAKISETNRPEELSIDDFVRLTLCLSNRGYC